jgi:hypothetical protein
MPEQEYVVIVRGQGEGSRLGSFVTFGSWIIEGGWLITWDSEGLRSGHKLPDEATRIETELPKELPTVRGVAPDYANSAE